MRYLLLNGVLMLFRLGIKLAKVLYRDEGVNFFLKLMPNRLIIPTLRAYGASIGRAVVFNYPLFIHNSCSAAHRYYKNLSVGNNCYLGRNLFLDLKEKIVIEDNVTISHQVTIITHTYAGHSAVKDNALASSQSEVLIRHDAYIGANVTILEGVEIGEGAIVGAGALVNKNVSSGSVVVGVPARPIR